ncbi:MAG TPA: hypothetical protein VNN15_02000 [Solirubrobacterales bacterium]|nr:hypothetical protein [Solirubrobacterales bacterium]
MNPTRLGSLLIAVLLGGAWIVLALTLDWSQDTTVIVGGAALLVVLLFAFSAGRSKNGAPPGRVHLWWHRLSRRSRIDLIAGTAAVLVFMGVAAALLLQPIPNKAPNPRPGDVLTKRTTITGHESGKPKATKKSHEKVVERQQKAEESNDSIIGRALDNDIGVILFRLGIALLAGFIGGLIIQRVGLGKYGVTLPFSLGGFAEITEDKTAEVSAKVAGDPTLAAAKAAAKAAAPELVVAPRSIADERKEVVTVGGELERALRQLAGEIPAVHEDAPTPQIIEEVSTACGLNRNGRSAIEDVITLSDLAANGAPISAGASRWFAEEGQLLPVAIQKLESASKT